MNNNEHEYDDYDNFERDDDDTIGDPDYQENDDNDESSSEVSELILKTPSHRKIPSSRVRVTSAISSTVKVNKPQASITSAEFHEFAIGFSEIKENIANAYSPIAATFPNAAKNISDILQFKQQPNSTVLASDISLDLSWEVLNILTNVLFCTFPEHIAGKDHQDVFCMEITKVLLILFMTYTC